MGTSTDQHAGVSFFVSHSPFVSVFVSPRTPSVSFSVLKIHFLTQGLRQVCWVALKLEWAASVLNNNGHNEKVVFIFCTSYEMDLSSLLSSLICEEGRTYVHLRGEIVLTNILLTCIQHGFYY